MEEKKQVETKEQLLQKIQELHRVIDSLNNVMNNKDEKITEQVFLIEILKSDRDKYQELYAKQLTQSRSLRNKLSEKEGN
ncbi:MAG: hypothetical protein IKI95_02060 [Clostridia bacterium]|nr:hypothetical protein [Clostridia bacterium]